VSKNCDKNSKKKLFSVWVITINCAGHNFLPLLGARKQRKKKERKRSHLWPSIFGHGCCGKDALAIGGATAADMAIVASAFNSDHPN
jgi:hypothetical protein